MPNKLGNAIKTTAIAAKFQIIMVSKIEAIKKAMDIVVRLQASLNLEDGGQIALNLDDLYTFCVNRLAMANASNDEDMIDEVFKVIAELKLGWSQIEHTN